MRLRRKILQFGVFAGLTVLATGCGGFRGKYSVSPLTFLLPGFGKVDAKSANPDAELQLNEPFHEPDRVVPSFGFEKWDDVEVVPTKELAQTENSQINS